MTGRRPRVGRLVRRPTLRSAVRVGVLTVFTVVAVVYPLWILLVNSAKPLEEANQLSPALPRQWALIENYQTVVREGEVFVGLRNTLIAVVPSITVIVVLSSMAAWVFARRRGRLAVVLYSVCIAGVLLPPIIITTIYVLQRLGLYGTMGGLIFFYIGAFGPICVFLTTGFVKTVPIELEEAALIDGATPWIVYSRVVLPLLRPIILVSIVVLLLIMWNDLLYQFFLIGGQGTNTLTLGLYNFAQIRQYQTAWNLVFSFVVIVSVVPILAFIFAQRRVVSGLTAGAMK